MTKATTTQVRTWMLALMARQAPQPVDDAKAAVAMSLPSLKLKFPAEAFCQASIDAIAGAERFWNEAGVTRALEAWWRANDTSPVSALPPEAASAPVSDEAKGWLSGYYRAENDHAAGRALDLIRRHSPEAFGYLTKTESLAASLAVTHRWHTMTPIELAADWDDEARIREMAHKIVELRGSGTQLGTSAASIALNVLVQAIKVNAPQHGPALFDELRWIAAGCPTEPANPPPVILSQGLFG